MEKEGDYYYLEFKDELESIEELIEKANKGSFLFNFSPAGVIFCFIFKHNFYKKLYFYYSCVCELI